MNNDEWSALLTIILTVIGVVVIIKLIDWSATNGYFIFYVPEGSIICVQSGETAQKFAGSIKGHVVGKKTGKVYKNTDTIPEEDSPCFVFPIIGAIFVGMPPFASIYERHFRWIKIDSVTGVRVHRDENTHMLVWRYTYGMEFREMSKDLIPVDVILAVTLETVDANASLFGVHDYLTLITGLVQSIVRDHIGDFKYEVIIESRKAGSKKGNPVLPGHFDEQLMIDEVKDLGSTSDLHGQKIVLVTVPGISSPKDVEISESAQEALAKKQQARALIDVQEAETGVQKEAIKTEENKLRKAKVTAKTTIVTAEADAKATEIKGSALANATGAMVKAIGSAPESATEVLVANATKLPPRLSFLTQGGSAPTVMVSADNDTKSKEKKGDK